MINTLRFTSIAQLLLAFSLLFSTTNVLADWMDGAKFYNARFCEPEQAFADQADAMRGLHGITNITDQFVTITCPVIRMQNYHGSITIIQLPDGTTATYPRQELLMIYRHKLAANPNIPYGEIDDQRLRCSLSEVSGGGLAPGGSILSATADQQWHHNFMTGIYFTPQWSFSTYIMQCILPPGSNVNGYSLNETP